LTSTVRYAVRYMVVAVHTRSGQIREFR